MSPLEILARQLDGQTIDRLGQQIGATPQQTQTATAGIAQTLLGAMARKVQRDPQQASKIERALDRDNHAALLDNLGSLLGGASAGRQQQYSRSMNGMGILQHVLGGKTGRVADQVSKSSGLDPARVGQLMTILAPIVMGALGKSRQAQPAQSNGIGNILGAVLGGGGMFGGTQPTPQHAPRQRSFLDAVLDRNGDGNSSDELLSMGTQLLGGLFRR